MKNRVLWSFLVVGIVLVGWPVAKGMERERETVDQIRARLEGAFQGETPTHPEGAAQHAITMQVLAQGGWHAGESHPVSANGLMEWIGSKQKIYSRRVKIISDLEKAFRDEGKMIPTITQYKVQERLGREGRREEIRPRTISYGDIPDSVVKKLAECALEDLTSAFFWFAHIARSMIAETSGTVLNTPLVGLTSDFFERQYNENLKGTYHLMKNILDCADKDDSGLKLRRIFRKHIEEHVFQLTTTFWFNNQPETSDVPSKKIAQEYFEGDKESDEIVEDLRPEAIRLFSYENMTCTIAYSFADAISRMYPTPMEKQEHLADILRHYRCYMTNVSQYKRHQMMAGNYIKDNLAPLHATPPPPTKLEQLKTTVTTLQRNLTAISQKLAQLKGKTVA